MSKLEVKLEVKLDTYDITSLISEYSEILTMQSTEVILILHIHFYA